MFSSNNYHSGNESISYSDQALSCRPFSFDFDSSQTSKQERNNPELPPPPSLSFFHFPSPFEDSEIFLEQPHDLIPQFHHHLPLTEPEPVVNMVVSIDKKVHGKGGKCSTNKEQILRRRPSKGDRHSKINTARGLRDRRMRLSLEVAKRFFGLQDMLGFDKASKTVEWLMNQAKVEINQLAREKNHPSCNSGGGGKSASSTSECEGVSSLDEVAVVSGNQEQEKEPQGVKRRIKLARKCAFHPLAKECRKKARKRARERTKEKISRRLADESKLCREATNHNLNQLGSWNPFETGEKSGTQCQNVNVDSLGIEEDMGHVDSLAIMSKWSPSMIFNSLNNSGFLQEHPFAESLTLGKPWETYNSHI